jgi:hypothetical protein
VQAARPRVSVAAIPMAAHPHRAARVLLAAALLAAVACSEDVSTLPLGPPRSRVDDAAAAPTASMRAGHRAAAPADAAAPTPPDAADAVPDAVGATLVVDHAWVRDAPTATAQRDQRSAMERLREAVVGGASFTGAWAALQLDPTPWHVADGERYPYDGVPVPARDLPPGSVSAVIPGDGGLHLFRIVARDADR